MAIAKPYSFKQGGTVSVSAGTTSANVAIDLSSGLYQQVRIYNASDVTIFVNFGDSNSIDAGTSDLPIASGSVEVISISPTTTHAAAESITGSANTIYFTPVRGV